MKKETSTETKKAPKVQQVLKETRKTQPKHQAQSKSISSNPKGYPCFEEIRQNIEAGYFSCEDVVDYYIQNIAEKHYLNVFLEVFEEEARAKAAEVDQKLASGKAGKLAGMVIGLKDVLCYKDHSLQASSKILDGFKSQFTASAVQKLLDEDAIVIGRQNCDEFAMGSSTENSAFGPVLNDIDHERVPGGSSGGSAVSVQAGLCTAALGSDTGGSVRQPAALCGVIGMKPTYSRISRFGLIAYASSFDTIGVVTNSIYDNALLLEVIAGKDENDSTVSFKEVPSYTTQLKLNKKFKIAYLKETLEGEGLNAEIKEKTEGVLDLLKKDGHEVEAADFPLLDFILPTYYILTMAEASANLERYDGARYGYRSPNATNLESMYKMTRSEGFGEEVKRRIMLGTFVLSASYYDAYYTKAQKVRKLIKEETEALLNEYDFIVSPTTPTTAFKIGELSNPLEMYLEDLYTVQANVSGIPAISIPNGVDSQGLPVGLQIMANVFEESQLFAFSQYLIEQTQ